MPCPFTCPKMFCAGPNFSSQSKNLTAFSASSKTVVRAQKPILLNANHLFVLHKMFVTGTICKEIFGLAQKFGPAQNILGPVKGQGISHKLRHCLLKKKLFFFVQRSCQSYFWIIF